MTVRRSITLLFGSLVLISIFLLFQHSGKAVATPPITSPTSSGWTIECVDCPKWFINTGDRALQIDADGHSHVVYGGDHLYYAWSDGIQWHYETVDTDRGTGDYASLALDSAGYPHIAYYDRVNTALKYAFKDTGGWHIQLVDNEGDVGSRPSLALDTLDLPHISYYDDTNIALKYASYNGTAWSIETVDSEAALGTANNNSLALDLNNLPHISYYDATLDRLKYAHWNGDAWEIQVVTLLYYGGQYSSIAVDSNNLPHVSFLNKFYSTFNLMYAHWDGSSWDIQQVGEVYYSGESSSIRLDAADNPVIAYSTIDSLSYAAWNGVSWDIQAIAGTEEFSGPPALALDPSGFPRISFQAERWSVDPFHTLNQASWDGSTWSFQTIDNSSEAGGPPSLALDASGNPRVAYRPGVFVMGNFTANLAYASWNGSAWQTETVVGDGSVDWQLSMALNNAGYPYIAYDDRNLNALRLASWRGSAWEFQTMNPGSYPSLDLDKIGNPHIAYSSGNLYYTYWDGNAWVYETVDNNGYVDGVSLALDSSGYAHIAYEQNNQVKYAWWDGAQWNIATVDANHGAFSALSLALDQDEQAHISYDYGYPSGVLRYATNSGGGWDLQTVDSGGDVGNYSSIAIDSLGHPHISYLDRTNADLKYAAWNGSSWFIQMVADVGYAAPGTSLKLDENNNPYIAYFDWTTRDVMLAKNIGTPVYPLGVSISGPAQGEVQASQTFTATTSPISTTLPVQYVWEATGQAPITSTGGLVDTVDFTWEFPGTKAITVTASNVYGTVSDSFAINLSDVPVAGLAAVNDSPHLPGEPTVFTATITAGTNVVYTWDFGGGSSEVGAVVTHTYLEAGSFTAEVTANNGSNQQTANTLVTILPIGPSNRILLPVIRK